MQTVVVVKTLQVFKHLLSRFVVLWAVPGPPGAVVQHMLIFVLAHDSKQFLWEAFPPVASFSADCKRIGIPICPCGIGQSTARWLAIYEAYVILIGVHNEFAVLFKPFKFVGFVGTAQITTTSNHL